MAHRGCERGLGKESPRDNCLMQIMPRTWDDLRSRPEFGTEPCDPRDNILAGAAYLREMHGRFTLWCRVGGR